MGLRRVVVAVVVAVVAASAVHASAARITLGGQQLAGGNDVVDRCDTSIAAALGTTGTTITSVTISDLAAACAGGSLRAVITSSGTVVASVGPTTVPT
ncbi:MAG TPA: hypothetical protein VEA78_08955, partial [Acidimicrobiales bacterium]|nr:hypothetical protein [Acidimicrobiales bacterium]